MFGRTLEKFVNLVFSQTSRVGYYPYKPTESGVCYLTNPNTPTNLEYVGKIPLSKLSCKSASRDFVSQKFEPPTAERRMLQANLDRQAISTIYSIPFKVTKDIRLAIFQFKIVHHILPTDATLFRDKIAQHDKCNLSDQKQTINYLFVSCPDVQIFWQSFSRWWNVQNDDFTVLNDETWFKPLVRVVRKLVNVNPGLNVYGGTMFSYLKMFLNSNVWCSLRLLLLKAEDQTK